MQHQAKGIPFTDGAALETAEPLKPALASIKASCEYMGGLSRAKFYADLLSLLETIKLGSRNFVIVASMDRLIEMRRSEPRVLMPENDIGSAGTSTEATTEGVSASKSGGAKDDDRAPRSTQTGQDFPIRLPLPPSRRSSILACRQRGSTLSNDRS